MTLPDKMRQVLLAVIIGVVLGIVLQVSAATTQAQG